MKTAEKKVWTRGEKKLRNGNRELRAMELRKLEIERKK